jgi:hypothetical protein
VTVAPVRMARGPSVETTEQGRFYVWRGERFRSVTTMISGGLPKPALPGWSARMVAERAVESGEFVRQMIDHEGPEEAARWLAGAPWRDRTRRAKLGSTVHEMAEAYVLGAPFPAPTEEVAPYLAGFRRWLDDFRPSFLAVEAPVFSRLQRYAGTLDAIAEFDHPTLSAKLGLPVSRPIRALIDYKTTGSGIYPEIGLQLAAYRYAETFVGLPTSDEEPLPEVDFAAAVWLQPDTYAFLPVRADEEVFRSFLYVREVYRWVDSIAPGVVGRPILPGVAA